MKEADFEERGEPAGGQLLAELEKLVGVPFPTNYREFLQRVNGGAPVLDCVAVGPRHGHFTDVRFLFGVSRVDSWNTLAGAWAQVPHLISQGLVPIGEDSGGGLFALRIQGGQLAQVLFIPDPWQPNQAVVVASSFTDFLGRLQGGPK